MPLDAPGTLSGEQYMDLITLVMAQNGVDSGESFAASDINRFLIAAPGAAPVALEDPVLPLSSFPQLPKLFGAADTNRPDDAELSRGDDADWLMYNKGYAGQR